MCGSFEECVHDNESDRTVDAKDLENTQALTRTKFTEKAANSESNTVEIVCTSSISEGEEVYNTYGPRLSNAQLLVNYGFSIDANEYDRVSWFSVPSVLTQSGLSHSSEVALARVHRIEETWRILLPELVSLRPGFDDPFGRVTQDLDDPYTKGKGVHDLLYIDADGAVSAALWLLLCVGTLLREADRTRLIGSVEISGLTVDFPAGAVRELTQSRSKITFNPEMRTEALLDAASVSWSPSSLPLCDTVSTVLRKS